MNDLEKVNLQLTENKDIKTRIDLIKNNVKDFDKFYAIILKGQVLSQKEFPIFFGQRILSIANNLCKVLNGTLLRMDKTIPQLYKIGFTEDHKIILINKKKGKSHGRKRR